MRLHRCSPVWQTITGPSERRKVGAWGDPVCPNAVADAVTDVSFYSEHGRWPVIQRGPLRIWDTIETAVTLWDHLNEPDISRFGVSALDDITRQYVWLDDPDGPYSWMPL